MILLDRNEVDTLVFNGKINKTFLLFKVVNYFKLSNMTYA